MQNTPKILYITWGLVWDLKTKMEKIHIIYKMEKKEDILIIQEITSRYKYIFKQK